MVYPTWWLTGTEYTTLCGRYDRRHTHHNAHPPQTNAAAVATPAPRTRTRHPVGFSWRAVQSLASAPVPVEFPILVELRLVGGGGGGGRRRRAGVGWVSGAGGGAGSDGPRACITKFAAGSTWDETIPWTTPSARILIDGTRLDCGRSAAGISAVLLRMVTPPGLREHIKRRWAISAFSSATPSPHTFIFSVEKCCL